MAEETQQKQSFPVSMLIMLGAIVTGLVLIAVKLIMQ
jgi:hypothetical protein